MWSIISGIIGSVILILFLNWLYHKCGPVAIDFENDMFVAHWLLKSDEEQKKLWAEAVRREKEFWENAYATMTDEEIEEKYCRLTCYSNKELENKRREEERKIMAARKAGDEQ